MRSFSRTIFTLAAGILFVANASAQNARPIPYPVMPPPQFEAAVENGTRTHEGHPGPNYWQNFADYDIDVRLDPETNMITGFGTITYSNNSPEELEFLVVKLRQNVHAEGVPRNRYVHVTGGITVSGVAIDGIPYSEATEGRPEAGQYRIIGTIMTIALSTPLATGGQTDIATSWSYELAPHTGSFRQGQDGEVYYVGYWYPQMAVYDDVYGWHTDQYMGLGEHYMGYGSYDVRINAPEGFLVYATGTLENPEDVLSAQTRARLDEAMSGDAVVNIVREEERMAGISTVDSDSDRLVWHFKADDVRDFAFSASDNYVWDATRAMVDRGSGEEAVQINAFYRPGTASWERSAEFGRFSVEHLSDLLLPYPYPHMTAVEGLIGGGMEYPMMTLIGGAPNDQSLFFVTYHEIAHMWFPMVVGSNEKWFTWMDEGLTSYNTNLGVDDFFDGSAPNRPEVDAWDRRRQAHYFLAGTGYAVEPMRHNDLFPLGGGTSQVDPIQNASRGVASYNTPAVLLHTLSGIVGNSSFLAAYRSYAERWAYKHPYPYDLFNTFEDVLGQDLDWFWTPTLFETWTVDHAIADVQESAQEVIVRIEDHGLAPMPAPVVVTYADGRSEERRVEVQHWLSGATEAALTFPGGDVVEVVIDPNEYVIDIDRSNNEWTD
ncbi:MAG: M1 family metallopeptidase, partial [Rubricoccaceae bacterium]|nr:M1 family metallopeptidase [Rubricoccaceae bacterium]